VVLRDGGPAGLGGLAVLWGRGLAGQ
jgi:hypothetical protein